MTTTGPHKVKSRIAKKKISSIREINEDYEHGLTTLHEVMTFWFGPSEWREGKKIPAIK